MTVSQNLNRLLSRVKNLFTHKADREEKTVERTPQKTQTTDQRLRDALAEVENYLADNFDTRSSVLTYKEYSNGISLTSDDPTFSTAVVILTQTNGMLNLPDNVNLLGYVETDKGEDFHIEHLGNFIKFLIKLAVVHHKSNTSPSRSQMHTMSIPTPSKPPTAPASASTNSQSNPSLRQEFALLPGLSLCLSAYSIVI